MGHQSINSQLIADQFAANGYFVVMPDLFYGDAIPMNKIGELDIPKWFSGGYNDKGIRHDATTVDPIVETCISAMRSNYNCRVCKLCHIPFPNTLASFCEAILLTLEAQKIGSIGYCFGAKYVARYLRPGQEAGHVIDVGFVAHPSLIERDELQGVTGPFAVAAAEHDEIFPPEKRKESEEILKSRNIPWQITLYGGVNHG